MSASCTAQFHMGVLSSSDQWCVHSKYHSKSQILQAALATDTFSYVKLNKINGFVHKAASFQNILKLKKFISLPTKIFTFAVLRWNLAPFEINLFHMNFNRERNLSLVCLPSITPFLRTCIILNDTPTERTKANNLYILIFLPVRGDLVPFI